MAPLSFRVASYGVYIMPFFINATAAVKTKCTKKDIELLLHLIPHTYKETASYIRPQVDIRHAFYVEHNRARGTFNDFRILDALTPVRLIPKNSPAVSWSDYDSAGLPTAVEALNQEIRDKAAPVVDLMEQL